MIGQLLCLLGLHRWRYQPHVIRRFKDVLRFGCNVDRCTRERCTAERPHVRGTK